MDKTSDQMQHKLLKAQEAKFKEKVEGLKAFIHELNDKSTEHVTGQGTTCSFMKSASNMFTRNCTR
jgi:hypothetical protein